MRNILLFATLPMAIVFSAVVRGQDTPSRPSRSFDVASIRTNHSEDRRGDHVDMFDPLPGGRFIATNCTLKVLIGYAFQTQLFQIVGIPEKLRSEHFDITAKAETSKSYSDYPAMVEHLLEDRFALRSHWETREAPAFYLVVDKPGKLQPAQYGDCSASPVSSPGSQQGVPSRHLPCGGLRNDPGNTEGYSLTASDLAGSLTWLAQRTIIDHTGLTGRYDVKLRWTPDAVQMRTSGAPESDAPSFPTAIREQLGLRLEPGKGPVKFLVIDHLEMPSEN